MRVGEQGGPARRSGAALVAVYCGVCATRIHDAGENYGSFQGTAELDGVHPGRIDDTCERCHDRLAAAVTRAANAISNRHRKAVDALRNEIQGQRDREEAAKREEADFRRAWQARQVR